MWSQFINLMSQSICSIHLLLLWINFINLIPTFSLWCILLIWAWLLNLKHMQEFAIKVLKCTDWHLSWLILGSLPSFLVWYILVNGWENRFTRWHALCCEDVICEYLIIIWELNRVHSLIRMHILIYLKHDSLILFPNLGSVGWSHQSHTQLCILLFNRRVHCIWDSQWCDLMLWKREVVHGRFDATLGNCTREDLWLRCWAITFELCELVHMLLHLGLNIIFL